MKKAILIQGFVKPSEIRNLFNSLVKNEGLSDYTIFFWLDSCVNMKYKNRENWIQLNKETFDVCNQIKDANPDLKIEIFQNDFNKGTSGTCYEAISYCFDNGFDYVLFSEDDTIFSKDSLEFFNYFIVNNFFIEDNLWAIQGESKFFDSKSHQLDSNKFKKLTSQIIENNLINKFSTIPWVPSTQFLINKKIWKQYGHIRGQVKGARDFGIACKENNGYSIFPIVPRVKDIGMLSENGYSRYFKGENVLDKKSTFFTSDDFADKINFSNFNKATAEEIKQIESLNDSFIKKEKEDFLPHMSDSELNLLKKTILPCKKIIEFGVGGSTKLCLDNRKIVYSFETNENWINKVKENISEELHKNWHSFFINIGKIKFLGYPVEKELIKTYSNQLTNILKLLNKLFENEIPLIFNDGRFRVLTHALSLYFFPASNVLLHDYSEKRKHYDIIFEFSDVIESKETMFLTKRKENITDEYLLDVIEKYKLDPR